MNVPMHRERAVINRVGSAAATGRKTRLARALILASVLFPMTGCGVSSASSGGGDMAALENDGLTQADAPPGLASTVDESSGYSPIVVAAAPAPSQQTPARTPAPTPAPSSAPTPTPSPAPVATPTPGVDCSEAAVNGLPNLRSVTEFGAVPNDAVDDTDAIERAIRSVAPGTTLVFPAGRYLHGRRIVVSTPGVKLAAYPGAHLHGTNPQDQAVILAEDDTGIRCFTLTRITNGRGSTPWDAGISIYPQPESERKLYRNEIVGNRILSHTDAQGRLQSGATSAGIFTYQARDFRIVGNTVERSLADGIHMTNGSRRGVVLGNTVILPGDDMIAVVSYGPKDWNSFANAAEAARFTELNLAGDVEIRDNDVRQALWGRGITVVGGENVVITDNRIRDIKVGAGILIARETSWNTYGVRNVVVSNNTISEVQTIDGGLGARTGQAGIELHGFVDASMSASESIRRHVRIEDIRFENNTVSNTRFDGVRISANPDRPKLPPEEVRRVSLIGTRLSGVALQPIRINLSNLSEVTDCRGNTVNGMSVACQ